MPTIVATASSGVYDAAPFLATATVAGVVSGVDSTPGPALEGVTPTLTYFAGTFAGGTPLAGTRPLPVSTP